MASPSFFGLLAFAALISYAQCNNHSLSISGASLQFGLNVHNALTHYGGKTAENGARSTAAHDNVCFSPISLQMALGMLTAGAKGTTKTELLDTLEMHYDIHQVFHFWLKIFRTEATRANRTALMKSNLFLQEGQAFSPAFLETLAVNYGVRPERVDFLKSEPARLLINSWFARNTRGHIKELLPPRSINDKTRLVLANVLYFKAKWQHQFSMADTEEGTFHLDSNRKIKVPMMFAKMKARVADLPNGLMLELLYADGTFSMVIFVPNQGHDLKTVTSQLDGQKIESILSEKAEEVPIGLHLPKFEMSQKLEMKTALDSLGLRRVFTPRADLSGINEKGDLFVDQVYHSAKITVTEEGTEASAGSGVLAMIRSMAQERVVRVDRPFFFILRDREFNMPLFMGAIHNPLQA